MPNQILNSGGTASLGQGIVPRELTIVGVATPYTISVDGGPDVPHVAATGQPDVYAVNGAAVSVTNTGIVKGPCLTLSW